MLQNKQIQHIERQIHNLTYLKNGINQGYNAMRPILKQRVQFFYDQGLLDQLWAHMQEQETLIKTYEKDLAYYRKEPVT